jgi:hypothetical protein
MHANGDSREEKMKRNVGTIDRVIRIVLAAAVAVLYFAHLLSPVAAIVLGVLGVVFLVTGILGFCPLYLLLGLSSKKKSAA